MPSAATSPSATPGNEKTLNPRQTPVAANNDLPLHTGDLPLAKQLTPAERIILSLRVQEAGESGRSGVHPYQFLRILFRSSSWASRIVNVLWPVVPAAIAVRYATPSNHLVIFILSYLAMVPCANMVGFAGQELGRKLPHVLGVLIETT